MAHHLLHLPLHSIQLCISIDFVTPQTGPQGLTKSPNCLQEQGKPTLQKVLHIHFGASHASTLERYWRRGHRCGSTLTPDMQVYERLLLNFEPFHQQPQEVNGP